MKRRRWKPEQCLMTDLVQLIAETRHASASTQGSEQYTAGLW